MLILMIGCGQIMLMLISGGLSTNVNTCTRRLFAKAGPDELCKTAGMVYELAKLEDQTKGKDQETQVGAQQSRETTQKLERGVEEEEDEDEAEGSLDQVTQVH